MVITVIASDASTLRYTRQSNETGFPRVEIFSRKMEKKRGGLGHSVKQEMALTKRQRGHSPPPQLIWSSQFPINVLFPPQFQAF
jgi:hypothetical protein